MVEPALHTLVFCRFSVARKKEKESTAELRAREHPRLLGQLCFVPLRVPVPSCQPLLSFPAAAAGPPEPVREHISGDLSIPWIFG